MAPQWFAVAVLVIPLSEVVVAVALGSPDALRALAPAALVLYPAAYLSHFFFGPLFEESGWRGFAFPRMQHRFGPVRGSLLLGLLWMGWHLLLYGPAWFQFCRSSSPGCQTTRRPACCWRSFFMAPSTAQQPTCKFLRTRA